MLAGRQAMHVPAAAADPLPVVDQRLGIVAYFALAMLIVRVGTLPEILFFVLHINTYLLYVVGPPALLGALLSGAVPRALKFPAARCWLGFFCWMLVAFPFSSWVGGSFNRVKDYTLIEFPMIFILVAIGATWKHVRAIFYSIAAAGLLNVLSAQLFSRENNGRVDLEASGTIGNPNDLASHLILILPFILFVAMDPRRNKFLRLLLTLPIVYGFYLIFATASRGALFGLAGAFVFVVFFGSVKQRMAALALAGIMIVSVPLVLGAETLTRLGTIWGRQDEEAEQSKDSRSYLLKQSIIYTLQHPLVGIGPSQFSNFEGISAKGEGRHGEWHETHNAFTEVSSECGIPALIFFVCGICFAFRSVFRVYRKARKEDFPDISRAAFCYLVGMVGYLITIVFLANAYRFYLPTMIGLSIVLVTASNKEMESRQPNTSPNPWPARRQAASVRMRASYGAI